MSRRQFATRYTDEQGVAHTMHPVPRHRAIAYAFILRENLDRNATVVARRSGGEWEHEWPKPENLFPLS